MTASSAPQLGLGTAQLGNLYRETSEHEVDQTLEAAFLGGIRRFDTAPHYGLGLSEVRLGERLSAYPRNEFEISTKVGRLLDPAPNPRGEMDAEGFAVRADWTRRWDFTRDGILRSLSDSLERTGLDRFDVVYLHDPDDHFEIASTEGIQTLIELRDQGVVGRVGAGMNDAKPLSELILRADVDEVMCAGRFTLLDQSAADDLLPLALERGVRVVTAGVYNSGLLSRDAPAPAATFDYRAASREVVERAVRIADVCRSHAISLPTAAVAFSASHPAVSAVVIGARGRAQVEQSIDRFHSRVPNWLWGELAEAGLISDPSLIGVDVGGELNGPPGRKTV